MKRCLFPQMLILTLAMGWLTTTTFAERTLEQSIEIDAPVAEVWKAFTTSEGFTSWAAPKAKVDFRIDGELRASYNPDSTLDDEHTIINRIISYHPQRMLSIRNVQAPTGFQNADKFHQTWTVVYFHPLPDDRTRVEIVGLGYGEGPEWDAIYDHFDRGNMMLLGVLKKNFEPKP